MSFPLRSPGPDETVTAGDEPVLPGPVLPGPVLPGPVLPGPVLPEQSREDTDAYWGEYTELDDAERLRRDRPPHWGDD